MNTKIQLIADGKNIDLATGQNITITFRSKFFQTEQGSRSWNIKCSRTSANIVFFDKMINERNYTINAKLYFGGIEIIDGILRILGFDDTCYNVILISSASTAIIDDQRKVVDIFRDEINRRGGFGAANLDDFHQGTMIAGNSDGRWFMSDYYDYSLPSIASEIKRIRNVDTALGRWPSDEFLNSKSILNNNAFCATDIIQLGGWTGQIIEGGARLPAHVYGAYGEFFKSLNGQKQQSNYIEFDKLNEYGDAAEFKIRDTNPNVSYLAIGEIQGQKIIGFIIKDASADYSRITLAGEGDFINIKPYIAFRHTKADMHFSYFKVEKLCSIVKVDRGGGQTMNYNNYVQFVYDLNFIETYSDCISEVNFIVQELPVEPTRLSKNNITQINNADISFNYWSNARVRYFPELAFGDIKVCDISNFCLQVLGVDLDAQNSAYSVLSEVTSFTAQNLLCEIQTNSDDLQIQNKSAAVGVVGADGFIFKRGGANGTNINTPFKGGGVFKTDYLENNFPLIGTTEKAATASIYSGSGCYVFQTQWHDNLNFGNVYQFNVLPFSHKIGQQTATTEIVTISKALKYTATGRATGEFLLKLKKDGQISINGRGVTGAIDEITWETNGGVKIVFWNL